MKDNAQPTPEGWEGLLDEGEHILWQGQPRGGLSLGQPQPMRHVMGLIFTAFSLFWISMTETMTQGTPGPVRLFPLFGLIFLAIGLWNAGLFLFWDAFKRSRTTYTLTNRRAFIATRTPLQGRRLESHRIEPGTPLDFQDGAPGSLWFGTTYTDTQNGTIRRRIGFERIDDARTVYRHLRDIQRAQRSDT